MKRIKNFALLMAVMATMSASAQNNKSASEWSSFYVQYNPMKLVVDISGYDDQDFTGFTAGYNKAISVAGETPLFVEVGGALTAALYSESVGNEELSMTFVSAKVPVSLLYKWQVSNAVSILPYGGLFARYSIIGNVKIEDEDDEVSGSLFSKKDMGSSDATWKRLQFGYQIGVNLMFNNKWHVGLAYAGDFSEVCKKTKFSTPAITLGFDF